MTRSKHTVMRWSKNLRDSPHFPLILRVTLAIVIIAVVLSPNMLLKYAFTLARAGHYSIAEQVAGSVAAITDTPQAYATLGNVYSEGQKYKEAAQAFEQTILRDQNYPSIYYKRARMLFAAGDLQRAVAEATEELKRHPGHIRAKYIRGLSLSYLARWEEAEQDFTELLIIDPEWAWTRIDLSWVYLAQGRYAEAEDLLVRTLDNHSGNAWALNNLGLALMHQQRYDEAVETLTKALSALDRTDQNQFLAAYPLNKAEQHSRGIQELRQGALFNLALVEEKRGNLAQAIELFGQLLADDSLGNRFAAVRGVEAADLERYLAELKARK